MGGQVTTVPDNFAYGVDGEYTVTLLDPAAKKFCRTFPTFTTKDHQNDLSHATKYKVVSGSGKVKLPEVYEVQDQTGPSWVPHQTVYIPDEDRFENFPKERVKPFSWTPPTPGRRPIERFQRESIRCIN